MNQLEQFQLISDAAEKFDKGQHIKPSVETSFMEGAYWANKTMLKEVLEWLEKNFYEHEPFSFDFDEDSPYECPVICDFESKEQMLQSFKERFNIE